MFLKILKIIAEENGVDEGLVAATSESNLCSPVS